MAEYKQYKQNKQNQIKHKGKINETDNGINGMSVKNVCKDNAGDSKIKEILLRSYKIFIRREAEKCL